MGARSLVKAAKRYGAASRGNTAAALTYYSVLSLFPAILVGTSIIGLLSPDATEALLDGVASLAPAETLEIIEDAVARLQVNPAAAGLLALVGLVAALWAASNYVAAFGLYVANFGSYDQTYGALGGAIVFLVWLWITNAALLFGSDYNASADLEAQPEADTAATAEGEAGDPSAGAA